MLQFFRYLGPGMLFAAAAVGVSHLVQSTRAGEQFGVSFIWILVAASLIKLPSFLAANEYSHSSGNSISNYYLESGRVAQLVMFLSVFADFTISMAAVVLVTAGLFNAVFPNIMPEMGWIASLLFVSGGLVVKGGTNFISKLLSGVVIFFGIVILWVTASGVINLSEPISSLAPVINWDQPTLLFAIAVVAWIPTPLSVCFYVSSWTSKGSSEPLNKNGKRIEFLIGYFLTIFLAVCFELIGSMFLHPIQLVMPQSATDFAVQLIAVISDNITSSVGMMFGVAACLVMISTTVSLMEGTVRSMGEIVVGTFGNFKGRVFVTTCIEIACVLLVLSALSGQFSTFVDFATSVAFLSAPFIAFYNFRAWLSVPTIKTGHMIKKTISVICIVGLTLVAIAFLTLKQV